MSRIGRKPISVPRVKIAMQPGTIDVQQGRGKLSFAYKTHGSSSAITFEQKDGILTALRATEGATPRAFTACCAGWLPTPCRA